VGMHRFRMPTFFLLSGFFMAAMVAKYGTLGTWARRAKRVAAPFAVAVVTVLPITLWLYFSMVLTILNGRPLLLLSLDQADKLLGQMNAWHVPTFSLMHLWFLHYLLVLYLLVPIGVLVWRSVAPVMGRMFAGSWSVTPWLAFAFVLPTAAALWPYPDAVVPVDDRTVFPELGSFLYYAVYFVAGYVIFNMRGVLDLFQRRYVGMGCVATLTLVALFWRSAWLPGGPLVARSATVLLAAVCSWAGLACLCGLFMRWFDSASRHIALINDSAYWLYLVQVPMIFAIGIALTPIHSGDVVMFGLLATLTGLLSAGSYFLVKGTWVASFLEGRWSLGARFSRINEAR
jgi:glucans biosynthesis protein C